jgi:hypothetical protein
LFRRVALSRRAEGLLGGQDVVVIIQGLESVTHLGAGTGEDAFERGDGRLSRAGLDPGDHRLRHAGALGELALGEAGSCPRESNETGGGALRWSLHVIMIPQGVSRFIKASI